MKVLDISLRIQLDSKGVPSLVSSSDAGYRGYISSWDIDPKLLENIKKAHTKSHYSMDYGWEERFKFKGGKSW